ncbi:MAG: DUF3231 family protein [Negativicutes bacterium]|nr:DUF3231 family protein [Negativicutes bacterium]
MPEQSNNLSFSQGTIRPHTHEHNIRLTAAEIGNLWIQYMNDSLAGCMLRYFKAKTEDAQIIPVLDTALSLAQSHLFQIDSIFRQEGFAAPVGFTDYDVTVEAPRLFSDPLHLNYVKNLAKSTMVAHGLSVALASRDDVRDFVTAALKSAADLDEMATQVMQSKGLYVRPPYITAREQAEYVQSTDFLGSVFGKQRMLSSLEVTHLFLNAQSNGMAKALFVGFSQVARAQDLRKLFARAGDIAAKHVEIFNAVLKDSGLDGPMSLDSEIMSSTVPPFSDKLMLYHLVALMNMALGYYTAAIGASLRLDLSLNYIRLAAEVEKLNLEAMRLLINNGWAEQPPMSADRKELAFFH